MCTSCLQMRFSFLFVTLFLLIAALIANGQPEEVKTVEVDAAFNADQLLDEIVSEVKEEGAKKVEAGEGAPAETASSEEPVEPPKKKKGSRKVKTESEGAPAEPVKMLSEETKVSSPSSSNMLQPLINAFSALARLWKSIIKSILKMIGGKA